MDKAKRFAIAISEEYGDYMSVHECDESEMLKEEWREDELRAEIEQFVKTAAPGEWIVPRYARYLLIIRLA